MQRRELLLFVFKIEFAVSFVSDPTIKQRCILLTNRKRVRILKGMNEQFIAKDVAMQRKKESVGGAFQPFKEIDSAKAFQPPARA